LRRCQSFTAALRALALEVRRHACLWGTTRGADRRATRRRPLLPPKAVTRLGRSGVASGPVPAERRRPWRLPGSSGTPRRSGCVEADTAASW
jgi:hypothetical protein